MFRLSSSLGADVHFDDGVVAVRMLADAVVVEQAMTVAEVDALGDQIHRLTVTYAQPDGRRCSAFLRRPRQRRAARAGAQARRRGLAHSRAKRPRLGSGRSARRLRGCWPRPPFAGRVRPVTTLTVDMREIYPPTHWAVIGQPPAYDTPDEDVYLEGRNIILIAKAAVLCARAARRPACRSGRSRAIRFRTRPASSSPAWPGRCRSASHIRWRSPRPFRRCTRKTSSGSAWRLAFRSSYAVLHAAGEDRHCGLCSKCRERQDAFRAAGVADTTVYAAVWTPG